MILVASNRPALSAGLAMSVDVSATFFAVAKAWRQLHKVLFERYRPELHYMRGPGPRSREKHGALQTARSGAVITGLPVAFTIGAENDVPRCARGHATQRRLPRCIRVRLILDE